MSTALDVATLLASAGQGTVGTDLFVNVMPETPQDCVAAFDVPSNPIVYAHGLKPVHQMRVVQIQARDDDPSAAAAKAQACLTALTQIRVTVNARAYEMVRPIGSSALLGRDDNGLSVFYGEVECWLDLG